MVSYLLDASPDFHDRLGIDATRLPAAAEWKDLVVEDLTRPLRERQFASLTWMIEGRPVGHCNINEIEYGHRARLHLHLWESGTRRRGAGTRLVVQSTRWFCEQFALAEIHSEPNAHNPAPNRTLARAGFELVSTYETTPGWINAHQLVNRWRFRCDG